MKVSFSSIAATRNADLNKGWVDLILMAYGRMINDDGDNDDDDGIHVRGRERYMCDRTRARPGDPGPY